MTAEQHPGIPTERLRIREVDNANEEILAFAAKLVADGKEPRFEVRYPPGPHDDPADFAARDEETFDAVEVVDGEIRTLPPYDEIRAGSLS